MPERTPHFRPPAGGTVRPPLAGWRRLVALASHPALLAILLLSCLWMAVWPDGRRRLRRLRARVPACSLPRACHILAGMLLERWPFVVLAIVGAGMAIGVLLAGFDGLAWGLVSSLAGASLAPVLADHMRPGWFEARRGRRSSCR